MALEAMNISGSALSAQASYASEKRLAALSLGCRQIADHYTNGGAADHDGPRFAFGEVRGPVDLQPKRLSGGSACRIAASKRSYDSDSAAAGPPASLSSFSIGSPRNFLMRIATSNT